MFRRLRNRLIIINVSITTVVLVVVFTSIYIIYANSAKTRPPEFEYQHMVVPEDLENAIEEGFMKEREATSRQLLIMLIVSGIVIDLTVAAVSYYMAEEAIKPVREAYESQKLFIANASHEIKTPLAAISANLEAADIKGNKWIKNVEIETAKLTTLNNQLLNLARTDLVGRGKMTDIALSEVVRETIDGFESRLKSGGIEFRFKNNLKGQSRLCREDFVQILSILLDNAIKYSDKKITVELSDHKLVVANDGAKISAKDLPHVFDRFYQADKSTEGVGLGLSIAKSLADRNNWKLSAESARLTRFVLEF